MAHILVPAYLFKAGIRHLIKSHSHELLGNVTLHLLMIHMKTLILAAKASHLGPRD